MQREHCLEVLFALLRARRQRPQVAGIAFVTGSGSQPARCSSVSAPQRERISVPPCGAGPSPLAPAGQTRA
jgi:hypothetical protein